MIENFHPNAKSRCRVRQGLLEPIPVSRGVQHHHIHVHQPTKIQSGYTGVLILNEMPDGFLYLGLISPSRHQTRPVYWLTVVEQVWIKPWLITTQQPA